MAYPGHREVDVALRDGSTVHVRPVRATDAPAVRAFFERLSPESTGLRFFSGFPNLDSAVSWATEVDDQRRYSLVATSGDGRVLAHAGWERDPDRPERAEVALAIADAMQGKGLGTILLGQLAEAADQAGIGTLGAEVLPHNHQMVKVFRDSGFPVKTHAVPGVVLVEVSTSLTPEGLERFERREQTAAVAAMRAVPGATVGGGGGRVPAAGHGRRRAVPQPARRRVQRPGVPGQPERAGGPVGGRLSLDRRGARPGRPGRGGRPRGRCRAGRRRSARLPGCGRWWCSRPASPRPARRAPSARPSCSGSAARPACG